MMRLKIPTLLLRLLIAVFLVSLLVAGFWYYWGELAFSGSEKIILGLTALSIGLIGLNIFQAFSVKTDAKKIAEEMSYELVESKELFSELYIHSPVPYLRVSPAGVVLSPNSAALRLFKAEEVSLAGNEFADLLVSDDDNVLSVALGKLQSGSNVSDAEVRVKQFDGGERWVLLSTFSYGNKKESLVSLVDITKQKEVDAAKTEFVSLASHQLRTPISSIKWNIELLESEKVGTLNEKQKQFAEKIYTGAEKMNTLINDFLSVSQLEMGSFATEPSDIILGSFLEGVVNEYTDRMAEKHITLNREFIASELPLNIDVGLFRMVVGNLVSNSVKYTPTDGRIWLTADVKDKNLLIHIQDTGIGIPDEELEKLFSKFYRASNVRSNVPEGTGLGLYIVARAASLLGGKISVSSEEGRGTRFTFSLPIA